MPDKASFISPEYYYSTLFHELSHSTGHASRLAREGVTNGARFSSHAYSREELVAEMSAAFLAGHAGIGERTIDNSAAYLASWIKVLKEDSKAAVWAAGRAQKASELILGMREAAAEPTGEERIAA